MAPKTLSHLVVGTGRCGTGSIRRLLRDNEIPCGHEAFFGVTRREPELTDDLIAARGRTRTDLVAESSWLAAPYLERSPLLSSNTRVIHLYRHPYRVIKSLLDLGFFHPDNEYPEYPNFAFQHAPRLSRDHDAIRNALIFYIDWNRMIRAALPRFDRVFTHRIEDETSGLCAFLEVPDQELRVVNQKSQEKEGMHDPDIVARRVRRCPDFPELVRLNDELQYDL